MIHFIFSAIVVVVFLALFGTLIGNLLSLLRLVVSTLWIPICILVATSILVYFYVGVFYA